jgi:hypothetical protein
VQAIDRREHKGSTHDESVRLGWLQKFHRKGQQQLYIILWPTSGFSKYDVYSYMPIDIYIIIKNS